MWSCTDNKTKFLTPLVQYISLKYVMTDQKNLYLGD